MLRSIGDFLWLGPALGLIAALLTFLIGGFLFFTIVGIPVAKSLFQLGCYYLEPFSSKMAKAKDWGEKPISPIRTACSVIGWFVYLPFGIFLALVLFAQFMLAAVFLVSQSSVLG